MRTLKRRASARLYCGGTRARVRRTFPTTRTTKQQRGGISDGARRLPFVRATGTGLANRRNAFATAVGCGLATITATPKLRTHDDISEYAGALYVNTSRLMLDFGPTVERGEGNDVVTISYNQR